MGLIESGTLNSYPAVDECSAHPSISESWGIDGVPTIVINGEKTEITVPIPPKKIGGIEWKLYRHPDLLVPDTCRIWKAMYEARKHSSPISEDLIHPCYLQAISIYESYGGGNVRTGSCPKVCY